MFELKRLSAPGIQPALQKAEHYRLLNEPWQAESICRDILHTEPRHQHALVTLILAIGDQFATDGPARFDEARDLLQQLDDGYRRAYFTGILWERRALAQLARESAGSGAIAYQALRNAMRYYEQAEASRPTGNDEALLRWNTCARVIERHELRPEPAHSGLLPLE